MLRLHFASLLFLLIGAGAAGWVGNSIFWEQSLERMSPQQRALYVLRGREYAENYTVERGSPPKLNKAEEVTIGVAPQLNGSKRELG